jgi:hypothetical protein
VNTLTETTIWGIRWLLTIVAMLVCLAWPIISSAVFVVVIRRTMGNGRLRNAFSRRRWVLCNLAILFTMWVSAGFFAVFPLLDPYSRYRFAYATYVAVICTFATIAAYWPKRKDKGNPCAEIIS